MLQRLGLQVGPGETEHVSFLGHRRRNHTVIVTVGKLSISKKALLLGLALVVCQVLDGILTFLGLSLMGVQMEGNSFLRELMHAYGMAPTLFAVKTGAIVLALILMLRAHTRKWLRPVIFLLVVVYFALAVIPWTYLIHRERAAVAAEEKAAAPPQPESASIRITLN